MFLCHWLQSLASKKGRYTRRVIAQTRRPRLPRQSLPRDGVELLEDRTLLSAPDLVSVSPNVGLFYTDGDVRNESPDELLIKFSPGQVIDATTVGDGIELTRGGDNQILGDADDVTVPVGYSGVDPNDPNFVVVRFAETLPDDVYQLTIFGTGATPLKNVAGDIFNEGEDATLNFELDLGAKVVATVPQPVLREMDVTIDATQLTHGDRLTVSVRGVTKTIGFQDSTLPATGADVDVMFSPTDTSNDVALALTATINGLTDLDCSAVAALATVTIQGDSFSPTVSDADGNADALQLSPGGLHQELDQVIVYFNNDDLKQTSAENVNFYQLHLTQDTISNQDDVVLNPASVDYDASTDSAVLHFASNIAVGTYRLRIGTTESIPAAPARQTVGDAADSFALASTDLGTITAPGNLSQVLVASVDAQPFALPFPGASDEPGHRDIPGDNDQHIHGPADPQDGIKTQKYNFRSVYGLDPNGNVLNNLITENQKQRAREIFELYGSRLGIDFIETDDEGFIVATGDLRAIDPSVPTGPGDVFGLAGINNVLPIMDRHPLAVMDNAESWSDQRGGSWFQTAMHEICFFLFIGLT